MTASPNVIKQWSKQGKINKSKKTYDLIKKALKRCNSVYCENKLNYEIYLQGSYKNSTNIDDSDIDVIVQLNSIYLSNSSLEIHPTNLERAQQIWSSFKTCILEIVEDEFGFENVFIGNKSIKIQTIEDLSQIDVVPCLQYRNYNDDFSDYENGITFWHTTDNHQIIHYPKRHYFNGVIKQNNTNKSYKSTIRIFKNIKTYLNENNILDKEATSSYFLECLLYNVPNELYKNSYKETIPGILNYLSNSRLQEFYQQHKDSSFKLFGNSPEQWEIDKARETIKQINILYKNL